MEGGLMDGRCKTCKWWGDVVPILFDHQWGICDLGRSIGHHPVGGDTGDPPMMFAYSYDSKGPNGPVVNDTFTRHDFGCVQWEAKDDE